MKMRQQKIISQAKTEVLLAISISEKKLLLNFSVLQGGILTADDELVCLFISYMSVIEDLHITGFL